MLVSEVPKLGKEAALKAIKDWGRPISDITHLVFATSSGTLRLAKDLAENNAGARVLVVCVDSTAICFTGPSENHMDRLVGQAIFGDGAAAAIVGAVFNTTADERPLFRMVAAAQTTIPNSTDALHGNLTEKGFAYSLSAKIPLHIGSNIEKCMEEALAPLGISDWNSVFYVVHPGGPAVLNQVEENLGLEPEKLRVSRDVLREYGNMWGPTVLFILDEMRKKVIDQGMATTGEGLEWGVLLAFGPGLTVETILLKSVAIY
ncbi:hypothetical protein FNV43_RR20911 [Rhamnella rubrinervis]|uniref:Chalcone synthase n=1 Tax=Rhamnella rubrinervis TaxID=2594499 RepID=A0A8K0DVP7_9ROSA|nr:hypothetical protein FNV43_RR20911 [Rhamnella rubrinervis]